MVAGGFKIRHCFPILQDWQRQYQTWMRNLEGVKYTNHFPPSWIMLEITTFGTVSILYGNLNSGRCKRQIAKYFGVADTVMVSFPLCKEPIGRNRALPSGWTVRTQNIECGF